MKTQVAILLIVASFAVATAVVPEASKQLRFKRGPAPDADATAATAADPAADAAAATATAPKPLAKGDKKPPSTTMMCLLALSFLFFLIVVMMKVISFKVMFDKLFSTVMQQMPGGAMVLAKKAALEKAAADAANKAKAAGGGSTETEEAAKPLVEGKDNIAGNDNPQPAAPSNPVDWVSNLFSTETLTNILKDMVMVPMFCILITFVRLRSRVDLQSEPAPNTKLWMQVSTACLMTQILLCLLPMYPESPDATGCSFAKCYAILIMCVNITAMLGLYVGIGMIISGALTLGFQEYPAA